MRAPRSRFASVRRFRRWMYASRVRGRSVRLNGNLWTVDRGIGRGNYTPEIPHGARSRHPRNHENHEGDRTPVRSPLGTAYAACCCSFCSMCIFGTAPTIWSTTLPSLKNSSIGIDRTLNRDAVLMFASTSSFVILTLPACSTAIWSRIGAIMRHGPHHVAQKSTMVSPDACSTSCSKLESVTATAFDMVLLSRNDDRLSRLLILN